MAEVEDRLTWEFLEQQRRESEFDLQAMKELWAGSKEELALSQQIVHLVDNEPIFDKKHRTRLARPELFKTSLQKAARALQLVQERQLSDAEARKLRVLIDEPNFMDLHWGMFIPAIQGQGTVEQQKEWLPLANKMSILGCYAQTELGHGSNVQGLETTATFDPPSDKFVMNSPTLTSTKWWPGGLGKVATHAIVFARLILGNKDYGVHAFVVQVRSVQDHKPLKGVTVGDIGVKFGNGGYNTMDNGYLRFDHVPIPRKNMLMGIAEVTREGAYIKSNAPKQLAYGAMVYVRQAIVRDSSTFLSRAITIAVRYAHVRRQFGGGEGKPETPIIDYKTHQHKLFPMLATAYAYRFLGEWMGWLYKDVMSRLAAKDYSTLPEVHACTSGLKSICTTATADSIEDCRKACGGHGYLCASGLPEMYAAYVPSCTYEGDNTILLLQVARFLLKTISQLTIGKKAIGTAAYLSNVQELLTNNCSIIEGSEWLNPSVVVKAFEARSARLIVACATRIAESPNSEEAFAEYSADLCEAAKAHCQLIIVEKFIAKLQENIPGKAVKEVLQALCSVYALSLVITHSGEFLGTGYLTSNQVILAKDQLLKLFPKIRKNALALVDAFDHSDQYLNSTLGRYDGDVYAHLYKDALKDPMNNPETDYGYQYLQPIINQHLLKARL